MLIVGMIDWDCRIIPDPVLISAAVLGVLLLSIVPGKSPAEALIAGTFSLGVVLLIRSGAQLARRHEWIGMGDVKLAGVLGLFLGLRLFLLTLALASIIGAICGLIRKKEVAHSPIPFGSFLAAVAVALFFWDEAILDLLPQLI